MVSVSDRSQKMNTDGILSLMRILLILLNMGLLFQILLYKISTLCAIYESLSYVLIPNTIDVLGFSRLVKILKTVLQS